MATRETESHFFKQHYSCLSRRESEAAGKSFLPEIRFRVRLLAVAMMIGSATISHAQSTPAGGVSATSYYIDLNTASTSIVREVQGQKLSIRYNDRYGEWNEMPLKIYNWKQEEVARLSVTKEAGLNYYNIDLNEVYSEWEPGLTYSCVATDENSRQYKLLFRLVGVVEREDPELGIFVNPVSFDCRKRSSSVIEYYGEIYGGKAPYEVTWYVVNDRQTNLLYQPRKETILKPGSTPVVTVDAIPGYYVMMKVKDACGSEQRQMVRLECEDRTKKINTLFVQPLSEVPSKTGK